MNTQLTIKNFRVFDENGVRIDIKPLTILTGCNSSGKSSIVKAAFLLNSFMKQVNKAIEKGEEIELSKYKIDFTGYPNNLLGRFDKIIPFGSSSHKLTLGYTIHSCMLSKDVDVELVFAADKNDDLNNAYLTSISMSIDEGVFYFSDKENGNLYNLNVIKGYLPSFVETMIRVSDYYSLCSLPDDPEFGVTKEEFNRQKDIIVPQLQSIGRNKVMDVVKYIRFKKKDNYTFNESDISILDWTINNDSYFKIPVLDYLHTIKKEDIRTIVENELIGANYNNTYLACQRSLLSASNKVLNDFMISSFNTFDAYFKNYENQYFENCKINGKSPNIFRISLEQEYTNNYPGSMLRFYNVQIDEDEIGQPVIKNSFNEDQRTIQEQIIEWESQSLTFDILYEVVMLWNEYYAPGNTDYYEGGTIDAEDGLQTPGRFIHHAFDMLVTFAYNVIMEAISASSFVNMSYVSSSRATVKKLYALDEKEDFTELLKRYFEAKRMFIERKRYKKPKYSVNSFVNNWIKEFGLGESLSFQLDEEGLGVKVYIHKSANDNGLLLADEGYGITQLISILLQIETAILTADNENVNAVYGLSVFDQYNTESFHFEENTITIEEPEIHLHPSYQSKLAEIFAEAYSKYNIHFIIETHSEYLIRKLQTLVAKGIVTAEDISIQYVYSSNIEERPLYAPQVRSIRVKSDGRLTDSFGSGFFDEADNAVMELLNLKTQNL